MGKIKQRIDSIKNKNKRIYGKGIGRIENFILSFAYKRNRERYVQLFNVSERFRNEEVSSFTNNSSSVNKSIYDVNNYPLLINEINFNIYKEPNKLILCKDKFIVMGDEIHGKQKNYNNNDCDTPIVNKTVEIIIERLNDYIRSVDRKIVFSDYPQIKQFISFLLVNKFECVSYSTVMNKEENFDLKMSFGKRDLSTNIYFPAGFIYNLIENTPIQSINFYDKCSLPTSEHKIIINDNITQIYDLYCCVQIITSHANIYIEQ